MYQRLGNRSSKVDVAAREYTSYNNTDERRQSAVIEAACHDLSDNMYAETVKVINAASAPKASSQSAENLRKMAVPGFVYNRMFLTPIGFCWVLGILRVSMDGVPYLSSATLSILHLLVAYHDL